MKRYFILSFIVHFFLLFGVMFPSFSSMENDNNENKEKKNELKKDTKIPAVKKKEEPVSVQIIEVTKSETKINNKDEKFYWGVGISTKDTGYLLPGIGEFRNVRTVTEIVRGYPADMSGLQVDDIVIEIDGKYLGLDNDLRGDGPRKMLLTVYRNGGIIKISIERAKIYYK